MWHNTWTVLVPASNTANNLLWRAADANAVFMGMRAKWAPKKER